MNRILFFLFLGLDVAALGLIFLLGLAAAGPSRTPVVSVVVFFLLPAALLAALLLLYLRGPWPGSRAVATVLAGLPVLLVAGGALVQLATAWWLGVPIDGATRTDPVVQQRLEQAIASRDAASVAQIASASRETIDDASALIAALRLLESHPGDLAPLRALLAAGASPDAGGADVAPLAEAIRVSRVAGADPVRLLLDAGADPNFSRGMQPAWFEALGPRTDPAVLPALLAHGASLQALDMAGNGPLYWALHHRHWAAVALLVERGADWRHARLPDGGGDLRARIADALRRQPDDPDLVRLAQMLQVGR